MIAIVYFNHFILSLDGEHVVLDQDAQELKRFDVLEKAMTFSKHRELERQATDLANRVKEQRAQALKAEEESLETAES